MSNQYSANSVPAVIRKILQQKKVVTDQEIAAFLNPKLTDLPHFSGMKGISDAVRILVESVQQSREIIIWGDYDVDGTTGTALLLNFFRQLGIEPHYHIPNRLEDGYGLHSHTFKRLHDALQAESFTLITVDCGISNRQEVEYIKALGGDVIVTDHHQVPQGDLPECIVVNPNQKGCGFNTFKLAGVSVAFYLAVALRSELDKLQYFHQVPKPNMKELLGFVALGTIADMVELTRVNRVLVRAGMEALEDSTVPGLRALMDKSGIHGGKLTTEDIGFSLGPRINAAGRMGCAEASVELMTCDNISAGIVFSKELEKHNDKRKRICSDNLESALRLVEQSDTDVPAILVVSDFHFGVIGIVASKLVDIYRKPAIVFTSETTAGEGATLKGSGRSIDGINLVDCLHDCASHIKKYGGHAMAAGLTVAKKDFHIFESTFLKRVELERINCNVGATAKQSPLECAVDDVMSTESLEYMLRIEPFGPENERPIFLDRAAEIVYCKAIGERKEHLKLKIRGKYTNYEGLAFGLGGRHDYVRSNSSCRILYTPMLNRYRGMASWQVRILDI